MPGAAMTAKTFIHLLILALLSVALAGAASAHPHVWVTMKAEVVYAPDGTATGVRHAWQFDDMYSAFATQGLESKKKGEFTREELAPLAEVNVSSLKEFDYFTYARANGKKTPFAAPKDYFLEYNENMLTLHFTLPFKTPVKVQKLDVEMYDPSYFVDFSFADKDPVALVSAPNTCKLEVARPADASSLPPPGENLAANFGSQFASKISVKCP
jgi:ABC-type uncharacterized transport system substrate-binding protein